MRERDGIQSSTCYQLISILRPDLCTLFFQQASHDGFKAEGHSANNRIPD